MSDRGEAPPANAGEHDPDWRVLNRANWDERVPIHLGAKSYDLGPLRAGRGRLHAIEEAELGPVHGLRVLHLQCHFGRDSLTLAQRGADVVGLDFSEPAIAAANELASELGLDGRARFVAADVYDAPAAIPDAHAFDLVYVTWGALCWLPDVRALGRDRRPFPQAGRPAVSGRGPSHGLRLRRRRPDGRRHARPVRALLPPRGAVAGQRARLRGRDRAARELQHAAVDAPAGRDRHGLDRGGP